MRMAHIVTGLLDLDRVRSDAISEYLLRRWVGSPSSVLRWGSFVATIWLSGNTLGGHVSLMREKTR